MKPQQTVPLVTALAPIAAAAPPVALLALLGAGLYWLLSSDEKPQPKPAETVKPQPEPQPKPVVASDLKPITPPVSAPALTTAPTYAPSAVIRKITREDLAEALGYGARPFTRKEAVGALEALGFRKTAAYKALTPEGKFGSLIEYTPDGFMEWKG